MNITTVTKGRFSTIFMLTILLLVFTLIIIPTVFASQEQNLQDVQTTIVLDFNETGGYTFLNVTRSPIVFGQAVSWQVFLLNGSSPLDFIYQTPPIQVLVNESIQNTTWTSSFDFITSADQAYINVPFNFSLPSASILSTTGDIARTSFVGNQIYFLLPKIDTVAHVEISGDFEEPALFDSKSLSFGSNYITADVQGANIDSLELSPEYSLSVRLVNLEHGMNKTLHLSFPRSLTSKTKFFIWNEFQTEQILLPLTYSLDRTEVFIDWTFFFNISTHLTRDHVLILGDLVFEDGPEELFNQTIEGLTNQTIVPLLHETNQTTNQNLNQTINFSFSTEKQFYSLGEGVNFFTEPNNASSFFYIFTPKDDVYVLKEPLFVPLSLGNYSVEASIHFENQTATKTLNFTVVEKLNQTLNQTSNQTIYQTSNETLFNTSLANETPLNNSLLVDTLIYNVYLGKEKSLRAKLYVNTTNTALLNQLRSQKNLQVPYIEQQATTPLVDRMVAQERVPRLQSLQSVLEQDQKELFDGTIYFDNLSVKSLKFVHLRVHNNTISLGIKNLNTSEFIQSYAIDPEQITFEKATITVKAKGNELYKCPNWNFASQTCADAQWVFVQNIIPGKTYTYELSPFDPGFGEKTKSESNEFLVQRGTASGSTAQLSASLGTSINTSQSFLVHYGVTGSATPDDWQFTGNISSSTGLTFDSYNTVAANVYWEVVTSDNLFVQRGQATLLTNNASATITLPDAIDLSRSFVIVNGRCNSGSNADTRGGFFFGNLTGTTTLQLERGNANLCDSVVDWQVVEWLGATVQSGSTTIADNTDSNTAAISAVNLSNSFLVFGKANYGSDSGMDSNNVQGSFASTTQLSFTQEPGSTYASSQKDVVWYVISAPELTVQSNIYTVGGVAETTPLTTVNMSRAFTSASWWSTGGGQTFGRGQSGVAITATNTLTVYKGQTNQNNDVAWFVAEYGTFDKTKPTISLNTLDNAGTHSLGPVDFSYTPRDQTGLKNCSLIVNGSVVHTSTSILNATPQTISYNFPSIGVYTWSINCTESGVSKLENNSETRKIHVFEADSLYTNGDMSNLTAMDVNNITNFYVENNNYGKINYSEKLNLSGGSNLDAAIVFGQNIIFVNSTLEPRLDANATISFYNVSYATRPFIVKNGIFCVAPVCIVENYSPSTGIFVANVTGFSNYTLVANALLHIWDDTDTLDKYQNEEIYFYANYSKTIDNKSINGSDGSCMFSENSSGSWSTPQTMTFNTSSLVYQINKSFSNFGDYSYTVSCGSQAGYENLSLIDAFTVLYSDTIPPNVSTLTPVPSSNYSAGDIVNITANVSDNYGVLLVEALLEWNGGSTTLTLKDNNGDGIYNNDTYRTFALDRTNITIIARDDKNNINNTEKTWINTNYTTSSAIYCSSSPCVANSSLIQYHGGMSPPEANAPNTIDACSDGTQGTWQSDESLDNITITSLNDSIFRIGDTVEVSLVAYCYDGSSDNINIVYTNSSSSPQWVVKSFINPCPAAGYYTYTDQFVLEGAEGIQAIRGLIAYQGAGTDTCAGGNYDDNDDLEILVQKAREFNPPQANLLIPNNSGTYYYNDILTIQANVTDDSSLGRVYVQIDKGAKNWEINLTDYDQDNIFTGSYTINDSMGNYTIHLFTIDEFGNENNTETDWFFVKNDGSLDDRAAEITLNNYPNNSGTLSFGTIYFNYTPTDDTGISSCELIIDGLSVDSDNSISNGTPQQLSHSFFSVGTHDWYINCTEEGVLFLKNSSEKRTIHIFDADKFLSTGTITDLTKIDVTNLSSFRIKHKDYGEIVYVNNINLSGGGDLNSEINFAQNSVEVDSSILTELNANAIVSIFNLTSTYEPVIFKDGIVCSSTCTSVNYDSSTGNFTFNVTGFSTYTTANNSQLEISDLTDTVLVLQGEQVKFIANYSKTIDGTSLNGTKNYCEFSENSTGSWSIPHNMTFNNLTNVYETNSTFSSGKHVFNVSCKNTAGYENISSSDNFVVGEISDDLPIVTLISPTNNAPKAESQVNFTCDATDDKAILNLTLYTNTSGSWQEEGTKDFSQTIIVNASWGEDVLTSGEFPGDGEDALGESLGQDYRIVEKFDLSSLPTNAKISKIEFRAYVDTVSSSSNHRITIYPYNNNVSYDPVPDDTVTTYDKTNDGTAFSSEDDLCSSSQGIGYSSWIDLESIASYYGEQTLQQTDLFSIGLLESGENDAICELAEYTSVNKPQLKITYVLSSTNFEKNFSVNDTSLGSYDWNCLATDTGSQSRFATQNRTIRRVKSYYPMHVSLDKPGEGTEFNASKNIEFDISAIDVDGLANCTLWTDKSGVWNPVSTKTFSGTSDTQQWLLSEFTNGTHKYNANCCDVYGDCAFNETDTTYVIYLDYENPSVTALLPSLGTTYNLNDLLEINATVTDNRNVTLVEALLEWDGGGKTYTMTDPDIDDIFNVTFNIQNLGRVNITIKAYDDDNNINDSETTWINVTYTTSAAIYCERSPCIANQSLIQYHGGMTPPEANQPNTIDTCTDGTQGTWQNDESLDFMSIASLNGSDFRIGDTVQMNITVYTWDDSSDNLNYIYTNSTSSINWKVETFIDPVPLTGFNTYTRTFILEGDVGVQAIRGSIQYNGNTASTCGTGSWDDNDDVEFLVQKARETNPPQARLIEPNSSNNYYYNDIITINANVTDANDLGRIYVKIIKGIQNWEINLTDLNQDNIFEGTFSDTQSIGNYSIQLFTIDEFGNENNSENDTFEIRDTGTLQITALACVPSTVNVTDTLVCSANASDSIVPLGTVIANVTYPNATVESQSLGNVSDIYNFSFSSTLAGDYDVFWWVNNTNSVSRSDIDSFRINELINPNVTLVSPSQGTNYNTSQNVLLQANVTDDTLVDTVYAQITLPDTSTEDVTLIQQTNGITYQNNYYLASQFGNYSIIIIANDSSGNSNNSESSWINVSYVSSGAKLCYSSPCIVASSLIASKDSLATPEPNSPNTLDTCSDGSVGTYQTDESVENITMLDLNGTKFRGGDTVEVNITAYCGGTITNINFVYANDSSALQWRVEDFQDPCPGAGLNTISRQFVLDKNHGTQAFRAIAKYQGTGIATCGGATRDDNDDFEFVVYKTREYNPPRVVFIQPNKSLYQVSSTIPVLLNITDQTDVDYLLVNLTWSFNSSWEELVMTNNGNGIYESSIPDTNTFGDYTLSVYANDSQANVNDTESYTFEVGDAISPIINSANATPNTSVQGGNITLYANVTDDYAVDTVLVEFHGVNQTMNPLTSDIYSYEFNTSAYSAGFYNFTVYANDTTNNPALSYTANFTIEKRTSQIQLFLNGTQANFSMYTNDQVNISAQLLTPTSGDILVYDNGTLIYAGVSPSENITIYTSAYNYNITAVYLGNENYSATSDTHYVIVNQLIPPNVSLIEPIIDSGDNDGNVTFYYNVTGGSQIDNCSLFVDDQFREIHYSVPREMMQSIATWFLPVGRHTWHITCSDSVYTRSSPTWSFDVINTSQFGGITTDFLNLNTSTITNLLIENVGIGLINYTQTVNLSGGANITDVVHISLGNVSVDSLTEPRLNKSAIITMYALSYKTTPIILQNNNYCPPDICKVMSYKPISGTLVFNVTHFTSYTLDNNSNLTIWDDSDSEGGSQTKYVGDQVHFFANYTNKITNNSINGSDVTCEISFNMGGSWTTNENMTFNVTSLLYEYNRSFSANDTYLWNVTCDGIPQGYEPLHTNDSIVIQQISDLTILDVYLSNTTAVEGQQITVHVLVANDGTKEAQNFIVQVNASLWNGTKTWNQTQNSPLQNLSPSTNETLNFTWTVKIGTYIFDAWADSTTSIFESNESNNLYSTNDTTSAWETIYGSYDYSLFLTDSINQSFVNWTTVSISGNLLYADADAVYTPSNLAALNGTDDLKELDDALGLSGFSDSASALFDKNNDDVADQTATFTIAGQEITGVPVINSTINNNFLTGLLWDSTDGVVYSGAKSQDVIFVTRLNPNKLGQYGTYDFEVIIPSPLAKLRGFVDDVHRLDELT